MDYADKKILENEIAVPLGKAVSQWIRKNGIDCPVYVSAEVSQPSCYIDEQGVSHVGKLVTVDCEIADDEDFGDVDD